MFSYVFWKRAATWKRNSLGHCRKVVELPSALVRKIFSGFKTGTKKKTTTTTTAILRHNFDCRASLLGARAFLPRTSQQRCFSHHKWLAPTSRQFDSIDTATAILVPLASWENLFLKVVSTSLTGALPVCYLPPINSVVGTEEGRDPPRGGTDSSETASCEFSVVAGDGSAVKMDCYLWCFCSICNFWLELKIFVFARCMLIS